MTWNKRFKTKHLTLDSHYCALYAIVWNTINRDVRTPHPGSRSLEDSCTLVLYMAPTDMFQEEKNHRQPCGERWSLVSHGYSHVTLVADNNQNFPLTRMSVLCCCDAVANTVPWPSSVELGREQLLHVCVWGWWWWWWYLPRNYADCFL